MNKSGLVVLTSLLCAAALTGATCPPGSGIPHDVPNRPVGTGGDASDTSHDGTPVPQTLTPVAEANSDELTQCEARLAHAEQGNASASAEACEGATWKECVSALSAGPDCGRRRSTDVAICGKMTWGICVKQLDKQLQSKIKPEECGRTAAGPTKSCGATQTWSDCVSDLADGVCPRPPPAPNCATVKGPKEGCGGKAWSVCVKELHQQAKEQAKIVEDGAALRGKLGVQISELKAQISKLEDALSRPRPPAPVVDRSLEQKVASLELIINDLQVIATGVPVTFFGRKDLIAKLAQAKTALASIKPSP